MPSPHARGVQSPGAVRDRHLHEVEAVRLGSTVARHPSVLHRLGGPGEGAAVHPEPVAQPGRRELDVGSLGAFAGPDGVGPVDCVSRGRGR